MAEQNAIDGKLEQMLQILERKYPTEPGSENCTLVREDGTVNEMALTTIVALIHEIKEIRGVKKQSGNHSETRSVSIPDETSDNKNAKYSKRWYTDMKVLIFMPIQTKTTKSFESAITHFLSKQNTSIWYEKSSMQSNAPLVVVCPITSRLEPDIDAAINGLNWPCQFVVLVMHVVRGSDIPRIPTASKLDVGGKYRNIAFIDIAFTPDEGIYTCQMNTNARGQLISFIESMYK